MFYLFIPYNIDIHLVCKEIRCGTPLQNYSFHYTHSVNRFVFDSCKHLSTNFLLVATLFSVFLK